MNLRRIHNIFFILLLLNILSKTKEDTATSYKIYDTSNTYPRPLLLDSEYVIAFSGNPGRMSKYNKNAEPIYIDVVIPNYQENVAAKTFYKWWKWKQ